VQRNGFTAARTITAWPPILVDSLLMASTQRLEQPGRFWSHEAKKALANMNIYYPRDLAIVIALERKEFRPLVTRIKAAT
jgi:hypothetical protein